ncbi:unnamed protein product [Moneuplotes crassus]|uniref:Sec23/Sec24 trunk domain-containing protein n=1 Tax=Euplotes crassus TaxID=5936 RepID=A0AAD2D6E9_EUPCR|nr:unnamed protein product [Moneuplotes crassus]
MNPCSEFTYIPKNIQQAFLGEEVKEIEENEWEVHSDSLNNSLDSGSEEAYGMDLSPGFKRNMYNPPIKKNASYKYMSKMNESIMNSKASKSVSLNRKKVEYKNLKYSNYSNIPVRREKSSSKCQKDIIKHPRANKKKVREHRQGRVFKGEVDTNVMSIDLKVLKSDGHIASGDPIFCEACNAVLNIHSKIFGPIPPNYEQSIWTCEFCRFKNTIVVEPEEAPNREALNYFLDNEYVSFKPEEEKFKSTNNEAPIIFCIDVSKSMKSSATQKPFLSLKDSPVKKKGGFLPAICGPSKILANMGFSNGPKTVPVGQSRYQVVSKAILKQIKEMAGTKRKVGVVFFNHEVHIHGDGSRKNLVLKNTNNKGDPEILNSYEDLLARGESCADIFMRKGVNLSLKNLQKLIKNQEMSGKTALGPAAVVSIAMAGKLGRGSTVVICTDGLSNVGVGNLADVKKDTNGVRKKAEELDAFYDQLAWYANQKAVGVHLISMKGEHSDLQTLMTLSDNTGGEVNIIDPNKAESGFANIVKSAVIATNVVLKVKLNRAIEFRNENENNMRSGKTLLIKRIGNVSEQSQVTFSYRIKSLPDLKKLKGFNLDELKSIPFQCIIEFTKLDGKKCIRTITKVLRSSNDKRKVEQKVDLSMIAVSAAHQVTNLAREGKFREAQACSLSNKKYLSNKLQHKQHHKIYKNWKKKMNPIYNQLHNQNNLEERAISGKKSSLKANKKFVHDILIKNPPSKFIAMNSSKITKSKKKSNYKAPARKFYSKMGDALCSNLNQYSRLNKNCLM